MTTPRSTLIVMPTGTGKCLSRGTKLMMFDGSLSNVEDVRSGNFLMGPDSKPRKVLSTASGIGELYSVIPNKGDPFTVNGPHILSLKITNGYSKGSGSQGGLTGGEIVNISVEEYLKKSKTFKHCAKGYRVAVDFDRKDVPIDPYFLGIWLGDGCHDRPEISSADFEVASFLREYATSLGLSLSPKIYDGKCPQYAIVGKKKHANKLTGFLRSLDLTNRKHIPHLYLANSADVRLQLLAGLLDSDGSLDKCGGYDFVNKSKTLAEDVAHLARTLGFAATSKTCAKTCGNNGVTGEYHRVYISGHTNRIPCRIARKQATHRNQNKDVLSFGFRIEPAGVGEYFGFELDGDRLFLLGDCTVTHNTVVMGMIARDWPLGRIMMIAHREELILQAAEKISACCFERCAIEMADNRSNESPIGKARVVVASVQTLSSGARLSKFDPNEFGLILTDECFPAGTIIDGKPIESYSAGDRVLCWNHDNNQLEFQTVLKVFKNQTTALVRLNLVDGRKIVCTPGHPIYTQRGYVPAAQLTCSDMVATIMLQQPNHGESYEDQDIYLQDLRESSYKNRKAGACEGRGERSDLFVDGMQADSVITNDGKNKPSSCVGENDDQKSNEERRHESKGIDNPASHGMEASSSGRERETAFRSTAVTGVRVGMGHGSKHSHVPEEDQRLARVLQSGHRESKSKVSDRSGWQRSQDTAWPSEGQEESFVLGGTWLESIEILQPGSDGEFERLCPGGFVHNLHIEQNNNYFVDGVLVHNCHHSTAKTYRKVYEHFSKNQDCRFLGVTATPDRADEEALGQVYDTVAFEYGILDAIDDGWLVPVEQQFVHCEGLDLSACRANKHDLKDADVARVMESEQMLHKIASPVIDIAGRRPTLVFASSVLQAHALADIFNRHRANSAAAIDGKTPQEQRQDLVRRFQQGEIQFLCNMGIFLEGFDAPVCSLVAMARPTKSRSLYAQVAGRGMRPLPNCVDGSISAEARKASIKMSQKPNMLMLDFVGNSGKHKLVSSADILGGNVSDEILDLAVKKVRESGRAMDMKEAIQESEEELHRRLEEQRAARMKELASKNKIIAKAKYKAHKVSPFDVLDIVPNRQLGYHKGKPPTVRQCDALRKLKVDEESISKMTFDQAGQMLGKLRERMQQDKCSFGQAKLLHKFGYSSDLSFKEASDLIDKLAKNNWRPI